MLYGNCLLIMSNTYPRLPLSAFVVTMELSAVSADILQVYQAVQCIYQHNHNIPAVVYSKGERNNEASAVAPAA